MVSILRIEGYEIIKRISVTEQVVTAYIVTKKDNGQQYMLRLAEFLNSKGTNQEFWYEKYEEYQLKISNFKYLPRVSTIAMQDENRLFTILDYEEGTTLQAKGLLGLNEIEQLVDAIRHLHSQKFVHGSISVENIWITNKNNRIILYGAGEYKAFHNGQDLLEANDIKHLVQIIREYSNLDIQTLEKLEFMSPQTVNEILNILEDAKEEKKKPGLVEQQDKKVPKPPTKDDTYRANDEKHSYDRKRTEREQGPNDSIECVEKVIPEKEVKKDEPINIETKSSSKLVSWLKAAGIGALSVLALLFVINVLFKPDSKKEVITKVIEVEKELQKIEETPVVQKETEPEPVSFTNVEVEDFMRNYQQSSIEAINNRDFSKVEQLIDPSGKSYKEQQDYLDYLESKNITEEVMDFAVNDIVKVDKRSYKVSTFEQYEISYDDGSKVIKGFNSSYLLKVLEDGRLTVNELLYNQQVTSETSEEPDTTYAYDDPYEEYISEDEMGINGEEYVTESDPADETSAIEGAVRLHYGSISNEDFDTAYNSFSSSRQKKMNKGNWIKGLQKNMYDEITTIQVESVDENTGRVYLEMTSYDDNKDGTTLVQDWAGYWNLVLENGRWTLDVAELKKVDSRIEQQ